ncbi:MAG: hypothetical protein A2X49_14290 [Lentisphaerae bacterium GWF2_52_8]|nr:MAG: hypothetical protein A2X49_14290 [Lentisphaerae bacterium GWF2_52_8]
MIEVIDEFYSAALAQETIRGMIENARGGYRNGGLPVYGYQNVRSTDGNGNQKTRYEINEAEARIVRLIFELYAKGNGLKNILMHLNDHGHRARSGGLWNKATIASIVRNEAYIGWTIFNKKDTKIYGIQFKPRTEWVIIKNTHPPIVAEQLFNRVQALIEERHPTRTAARTTASTYLLSGLMTCDRCGSSYGVTGYGRGKKYAYYNCLTYSKKGKQVCPGHSIRADELDAMVIAKVRERLFSEFNIRQLLNDLNVATRTVKDGRCEQVKDLKRRLADKEARLLRQYEAIESGKIDLSLIGDRLRALKAEQNALREELANFERETMLAPPVITRAIIERYRQEMEQVFIGENVQEQRAFLKNFIEKVVVGESETRIVYYAGGIRIPSGIFPATSEHPRP